MNLFNKYFLLIVWCNLGYSQFNTIDNLAIPPKNVKEIDSISKPNFYRAKKVFSLPMDNMDISSYYGMRKHPISGKKKFHSGLDIRGGGMNVYSSLEGLVTEVNYNSISGIFVKIESYLGMKITIGYLHLSRIFIRKGDFLYAGDFIGITGGTGAVTGDHLHYSVQIDGNYCDPVKFIELFEDFKD